MTKQDRAGMRLMAEASLGFDRVQVDPRDLVALLDRLDELEKFYEDAIARANESWNRAPSDEEISDDMDLHVIIDELEVKLRWWESEFGTYEQVRQTREAIAESALGQRTAPAGDSK